MQKSTEAKRTTERAEAKEQAQLDILAWISDKTSKNQDSTLNDSIIQGILDEKSYVKEAKSSSFITAKGEYEIPYSELYQSSNVIPSDPVIPTNNLAALRTKIEAQSGDCMIDENENIIPIDKWSYQIIAGTDTFKIEGYDDSDEGIIYSAYNGTILEENGKRTLQYNIPVFIKKDNEIYQLTELGDYALADMWHLNSVSIPNGVTTIGWMAFYHTYSLGNIKIPDSVTTIKDWAFQGCTGLTSVEIGSGITSISGDNVFESCSDLTDIYINKSENSISGAPWGAPNSTTITWND